MKTVYIYDATTREYKEPYNAQESPLEPGQYIIPTDSTLTPPPTPGTNQVAVFKSGAWSLVDDYRGQMIYNQSTGASQEVTTIGPIPSGFSLNPSPPTLSEAKSNQIIIIQNAAITAEISPLSFTTSAKVSTTFPMDSSAQIKYLGAYTRYVVHAQPLPSNFYFYDSNGKSVAFTVSDIDAFATAGFTQVETALAKEASLIAQIEAATTVAAVQAIVW